MNKSIGPVSLESVLNDIDNPASSSKETEFEQFQREAREYMSIASSEEGEVIQTVVDTLQPVKISKEIYDAFDATLFLGRTVQQAPLLRCGEIAASMNTMFGFMRYVLNEGAMISYRNSIGGAASVQEYVQQLASNYHSQIGSNLKKSLQDDLRSHLGGVVGRNKFRLMKSNFYTGGIDIVLNEGEQDSNIIGMGIGSSGTVIANKQAYNYEDSKLQNYSSEPALAVLRAARRINKELFGNTLASKGGRASLYKRFDHDWAGFQRILENELGYALPVQFFADYEEFKAPARAGVNWSPEMFVACGLTAHYTSAAGMERVHNNLNMGITGEGVKTRQEAYDLQMAKAREDLSEEAELLNLKFGGATVYTFAENLCEFISQSQPYRVSGISDWFKVYLTQFIRAARQKAASNYGNISRSAVPRFSLPLDKLKECNERMSEAGMVVEDTRANEDGLFLATEGNLRVLPATSQRDSVVDAEDFAQQGSKIQELAMEKGVSVHSLFDQRSVDQMVLSDDELEELSTLTSDISSQAGKLVGYEWGLGVSFFSDGYGGIRFRHEAGAVKPQDLSIAELLGYNMAKEGEEPEIRSASQALLLGLHADPNRDARSGSGNVSFGTELAPTLFTESRLYQSLAQTFVHYRSQEGVNLPTLDEMMQKAYAELRSDIEAYPDFAQRPYDQVVFWNAQGDNPAGSLRRENLERFFQHNWTEAQKELAHITNLIEIALRQVSPTWGSPVYKLVLQTDGVHDIQEVRDHERSFVFDVDPMHKLRTSLYRTFGGHILKQLMEGINSLTFEQLNNVKKTDVPGPTVDVVLETVKPMALLMGKYVENYDEWKVKADNELASISRDPSIDQNDLNFAGGSDSFAMFPHQLDTQRYLRKSEPPAFAILDIAPGGGKTSIGIVDMACVVDELAKRGEKIIPLVMCPDNLIRNWCDDTNVFTKSGWNTIPINTAIVKRWGQERIIELIKNAPPNTICVAGFNFMNLNKVRMSIGGAPLTIGFNVEMLRTIGFNYVIIDESHKLKNLSSNRHKAIKVLTTSPHVKYLRIATGTLIVDRVKDIEGQVALHQPNIFRAGELAETIKNKDKVDIGDEEVEMWKVSSPKEARRRLAKYAAVITKARKEWAFMLPSPIEALHHVDMMGQFDDPEYAAHPALAEFDRMHHDMYQAVLQETIEELSRLLRGAKRDEDEDDDEGFEMSELDEFSKLKESDFKPHLARLERLILNPAQDAQFHELMRGAKPMQSRKTRKVIEIIRSHFNMQSWSMGANYNEYDQVKHDGKYFLARKFDETVIKRQPLPATTVGIPPAENPEFWREEPEGKLIVFCRYTRSVETIFEALPEEFKSVAVRYHGGISDRLANLELFKRDPKVKILVANEQGLSEGHNLQMASRIIRVESPWGPGEASQTESRIFRPDPKGAADGEIYREIVYLDWVCTNGTMEIPKFARFVKKSIDAARFDEADNPRYDEALAVELDEVGLGLNMLQAVQSVNDISDYLDTYIEINGLRNNEFLEMRRNGPASMIPIPPTPNVDGAEVMKVLPFVSAQNIPDPEGLKPEPLSVLMENDDYEDLKLNPDNLIGKPIITDMGRGMIISVRKRWVGAARDGVLNPDNPVSSVNVRLKGSDEILTINDLGLVFLPTKISKKQIAEEFEVSLIATQAQQRKHDREQRRLKELQEELEAKEREEQEREEARKAKVRTRSRAQARAKEDAETRKQNLREGKPINRGVRQRATVAAPIDGVVDASRDPLRLTPAYYHGFLTLETTDFEYAKELKKLKFKEFGEYMFVEIKRKNHANKVFDYIEENFEFSTATANRLSTVFKAFEEGYRGLYKMELAPTSELPHFFAINKRIVTNPNEIRLYPMFKDDVLTLMCDIRTNPAIRKHVGKSIPGASTKWRKADGLMMAFFRSKPEMREMLKKVRQAGIEIADEKGTSKAITDIRHRRSAAKPKGKK